MSRMSELDLERRDIEDGLRPMDMGTVFYITTLMNGMGLRADSAIINQLLEQHARRYPVLYRNSTNQASGKRDTASQYTKRRYTVRNIKPGIAVAEKLSEQGELDLPEGWHADGPPRTTRNSTVEVDTDIAKWVEHYAADPKALFNNELDDLIEREIDEHGVLVKTPKPPTLPPYDSLTLAVSHNKALVKMLAKRENEIDYLKCLLIDCRELLEGADTFALQHDITRALEGEEDNS